MIVKLELKPEIEITLTVNGLPLDAYLLKIIEALAFAETLDLLAEMGRNLPLLAPASLSRESISLGRG